MSSPYEFYAAREGYLDKLNDDAGLLRIGFYRIHQSLIKDALPIQEFWPLTTDTKKQDSLEFESKEQQQKWWEDMKRIHKF